MFAFSSERLIFFFQNCWSSNCFLNKNNIPKVWKKKIETPVGTPCHKSIGLWHGIFKDEIETPVGVVLKNMLHGFYYKFKNF